MILQEKRKQSIRIEQIRETLINALDEDTSFESSFKPKYRKKEVLVEACSPTKRHIDGKSFFAETRKRLSYDRFSQFLSYIKKLNDKSITRAHAIKEVKILFADKAQDLYQEFIHLITKKNS